MEYLTVTQLKELLMINDEVRFNRTIEALKNIKIESELNDYKKRLEHKYNISNQNIHMFWSEIKDISK